MKVTLLKAWRVHAKGKTVDLPTGIAKTLVESGKAVEAKVIATPPRNKAVKSPEVLHGSRNG